MTTKCFRVTFPDKQEETISLARQSDGQYLVNVDHYDQNGHYIAHRSHRTIISDLGYSMVMNTIRDTKLKIIEC